MKQPSRLRLSDSIEIKMIHGKKRLCLTRRRFCRPKEAFIWK